MYRAPLALLVAATLSGAATYVGCSSEPELRLAEPQRQIADPKPSTDCVQCGRDQASGQRLQVEG